MCWDTTSYGSKDGRNDAPAAAPASRPHRRTAVLPMDGSERYGFAATVRKRKFAGTAHADGLTIRKR